MKGVGLIATVFGCLLVAPLYAQIPHFQHIIVIVQENRTPDNMFQGLCAPPYGNSQSCSINPGPINTTFRPRSGTTRQTSGATRNLSQSASRHRTIWITLTRRMCRCATTCLR